MKSYNIDMDISNIIYYLWTHAEASKSHIQTFFLESIFFKIELNFFFFFFIKQCYSNSSVASVRRLQV